MKDTQPITKIETIDEKKAYLNDLYLNIVGVAQDDCAIWANSTNDQTGCPRYRIRTTNAEDWLVTSSEPWHTGLVVNSAPDITNVISEIISRPGYEAGNAIGLIVDHTIGSGEYWRYFATINSVPEHAAKLATNFTNFSNEIRFPNVALSNYLNATVWHNLIFSHDVSCTDCEIIYEVRNAANNNLIATGNTSPISLNSSTANEVYVVAKLNRPASESGKLFDLTLTALVPPIADFIADTTEICVGDCVNFTDFSENNPNSWYWTFEGADTPNSVEQNPSNICYNQPGTYFVSLEVSNSDGSSNETKNAYINVSPFPTALASNSGPYCEGDEIELFAEDFPNAEYYWSDNDLFTSDIQKIIPQVFYHSFHSECLFP